MPVVKLPKAIPVAYAQGFSLFVYLHTPG